MSTSAAVGTQAGPARSAVRLPPGPAIPKVLQGILFTLSRRRLVQQLTRRYGTAFTINTPVFGPAVV
ncbi:MAG: cytochrome P450, partial [Mycobacterium sp.]